MSYLNTEQQPIEPKVVGDVAICKNPCFHPGDFRRLQGVACRPGLEHYRNVLVFPKVGSRPHPNEITGSDLDGDLFFVTWNPRLTDFVEVQPMDFSAVKDQRVQKVTIESISEFFLKYMMSDALGKVANTHLALATMREQKAYDEDCINLAKLHSTAVDFAKTGIRVNPADIPRVEMWPDFMKKKHSEEWDSSNSLLGKLWRQSQDIESESPKEEFYDVPPSDGDVEGIHLLYSEYKEDVRGIMNIYDIRSEVEVLTGEISTFAKHFKNKNKYKRREETRHKLQLIVTDLVDKYQRKFLQMQGANLAIECLNVAYKDEEKFYGFPWVAAGEQLLKLASN